MCSTKMCMWFLPSIYNVDHDKNDRKNFILFYFSISVFRFLFKSVIINRHKEESFKNMKASLPSIITDEPRSLTPEPNHPGNRTPRRSHVSIASSKRPSMNAGVVNPNKIKQGMFRRAVPQMPRVLACICFVFNLVLPGTGMESM